MRFEGATLVWWEAKTKYEIKAHGEISISWSNFIAAITRNFEPREYMYKSIMNWYNFKELKGQNVQYYTQEFRRISLMLGVDLQSQDTLLKYIGGLHSYVRHTILMFNPISLDEVSVQATHLEARGKNIVEEGKNKPFNGGEKGNGFKGKGKKNSLVKNEGDKIACKLCSKEGHDKDHCWNLHPEMRPKKFNKGKKKTTTTTQQELGYDSGDETKITTMGMKGK